MRYSPSTRGFYEPKIHGAAMPADALEISDDDYKALVAGQASGKVISIVAGKPTLAAPAAAPPTSDDAAAECRRRILAVATEETQLNIGRRFVVAIAKTNKTPADLADIAAFALFDAWINATRATWPTLVAAKDMAWRDDSKWPVIPADALAFVNRT
jgi:hypothetical protein